MPRKRRSVPGQKSKNRTRKTGRVKLGKYEKAIDKENIEEELKTKLAKNNDKISDLKEKEEKLQENFHSS